MNRNKGIWIVIGSILAIGIFITNMTTNFVENQEAAGILSPELSDYEESIIEHEVGEALTAAFPEPEAEERDRTAETEGEAKAGAGMETKGTSSKAAPDKAALREEPEKLPAEASLSGSSASLDTAEAPDSVQTAPKEEESPETLPAPPAAEPVITPVSPDSKSRSFGAAPATGAAYYQKHLAELDVRIKKMREESGDSNTYSMKVLADKELKLWNQEMNAIYTSVFDKLDDQAKQALEEAQRTWVKTRDTKAEEAAKKYSGGSLEGLEYTASMAESTRNRAYDLVDEYMEVLSDTEGQ